MSGGIATHRTVRVAHGLALGGAVVAPVAVLAVGALSTGWFFPQLLPSTITGRHVVEVVGDPSTRSAMWTGLRVSLVATVIAMGLAWPAAQLLARPHLLGRAAIAALLFVPSVMPAVGLAIGIDILALRTRTAGTTSGVVVAHLVPTIPYVTAVLTAGFVRHDRRLEATAAVLGASDRQRLRLVTLPAMRGALVVAGALGFAISWSQYLLTVLVGSGRVITITMLLFGALSGGNPSTIGVLALVAAAPAALLLVAAGTHADRRAAS